MREIKFRAWNIKQKRMSDGDVVPAPLWWKQTGELTKSHLKIISQDDKDYVLMQYTGLTDKNGKEIYEGDILRLKNSKGQISNHQEVYWNSETASFDWRTSNDDSWPDGFTGFYDEYEVRGNIYENPDLLEVKQ
jgi:uncharacterized phage protein (TIGR01671 family)